MTDLATRVQSALAHAYTIERELGGGGMSRVFVATETALGRQVVIKVLPSELGAGLSIDRFRREIQLVASLQHPHIVPLLAAGSADGLLYYTMPLVEGESLRARISRDGQLQIAETIRLLRDVVDALACAHDHGIIHRDIKPDNVLVSRSHGLVTDFGVAKALSEATTSSSSWQTTGGLALGTPAYMAPEQVTAAPDLDHRVDVYAVGALAYEMLSGKPPFTGSSAQAVLAAQVIQTPEPITQARRGVPADLAAIVMRCLEKEPASRWQTAGELLQQLDSLSDQTSARHPIRALALFGLASALILAMAWVLTDRLGLPDWVFPGAVLLLVIGLPIIATTAVTQWRGAPRRWLSWRRAILGGVAAFLGLAVLTGGYMLLRALGIGPVGSLVASGVLKERERVIVADFVNRTGDPLLGDALTQAFRVDFAQSPVVRPVESEQVHQALRRMGRADSTRVDPELAREIAIREGIKAVVTGAIDRAGPQLIVSAQLLSAVSGTVLAAYRERAEDSTEVIRAVDRLSARLRERIGESLRTIRGSPPLAQVTTSSLEALRKYSQGRKVADAGDFTRGVDLLEQAIALDSGFASAYRALGVTLGNYGVDREREIQAHSQAFRFRDRLPPRERYLTTSSYHAYVNGDWEKAKNDLETLLDFFPDDAVAMNNLGVLYDSERDHARAMQLFQRAITADPGNITFYSNLIDELFSLGRIDSAQALLRNVRRRFPENPLGVWYVGLLHSSLGRYDSAAGYFSRLAQNQQLDLSWRSSAHAQLADVFTLRGQAAAATRHARAGRSVDEQREFAPGIIRGAAVHGLRLAILEYRETSPADVEEALRRYPLAGMKPADRPYLDLAQFYAATGRTRQARALLSEYERVIPLRWRRNDEPKRHLVYGQIALRERKPGDAIAEFRAADEGSCRICPLPGLARAYDLAGEPDSALAIYLRYVTTPTLFRILSDGIWLPSVYYRLGELYEARGDRSRAAEYYGRFAELWADADAALQPRVAEARRRLAGLTAEPRQ
jgi:tetratricopeptide (TPR) repeat protein